MFYTQKSNTKKFHSTKEKVTLKKPSRKGYKNGFSSQTGREQNDSQKNLILEFGKNFNGEEANLREDVSCFVSLM